MIEQSRNRQFNPPEPCPITQGRATSYDKAIFENLCQQKQDEKVGASIINSQCQVCLGKTYPSELTITGGDMPVIKDKAKRASRRDKGGVCEFCGGTKNVSLRPELGLRICTTCTPLVGCSKHRPQSLVKALGTFHDIKTLLLGASTKESIKKIADQDAMILELSKANEESQKEVEQLKKDLIQEKEKAEMVGIPDQLSKGGSHQETVMEALKISDAEAAEVEQKNRDLMGENVCLGLALDGALTTLELNLERIGDLEDKILRLRNSMDGMSSVNSKNKHRGDLAFYLLEGMASNAPLSLDVETVRKVAGAVS